MKKKAHARPFTIFAYPSPFPLHKNTNIEPTPDWSTVNGLVALELWSEPGCNGHILQKVATDEDMVLGDEFEVIAQRQPDIK